MADPQPRITAVILNTNRREDTLACLASLARQQYANLHQIVLDNASSDGSVEAIRAAYPQVQILSLTQNLGYAGNNNVGIAAALEQGCDWVFVLNEDVILAEDALAQLAQAALENPRADILGPLVYHFDHPQVIQTAGGVMTRDWTTYHAGQNEPDAGQYAQTRAVDWISGCAILVRSTAIRQHGMIDPRFFYYFEETEWCVRIGRGGGQILMVPAARIWHKGVQVEYQPNANVTYYAARNRMLLFAKHHAPLRAWAALLLTNLRTLGAWTLLPRWRDKRDHRDALWQGMLDFARRRWGMRPAPPVPSPTQNPPALKG